MSREHKYLIDQLAKAATELNIGSPTKALFIIHDILETLVHDQINESPKAMDDVEWQEAMQDHNESLWKEWNS